MTMTAFLAAWGLHLMAAASPGPAILMSARLAVTQGLRAAIWLAIGLGLGACFWAAAALFGLALLFQVAPALLWALKIVGGLFLLRLGYLMWKGARAPLDTSAPELAAQSPWRHVKLGIMTQLSNPKPAVFFGAVFVGTVPQDAPFWVNIALLVMIFANEIACNLLIARIFSLDSARRRYVTSKTLIDRSFGAILGLLGLKIAAT